LKDVLAMIDKQPTQVLIEGIIVEASLDEATDVGLSLNWTESPVFGSHTTAAQTKVNLPPPNPANGLNFSLLGSNFQAILNAVRTDQRFNILSTPRIFTENNEQAAITVGQSVPLLNASNSFGSTSSQIVYKDVGVTLDITPHITGDGYVNIEVGQDADEISGYTTLAGNQVPNIAKRTIETTVTAKDGQTVVLGGLIRNSVQNNQTKIPILGDLPIVGGLFRSKGRSRSKTELMIFLRPQIVRYDDEVDDLTKRQGDEAGINPSSANGRHLGFDLKKNGFSGTSEDRSSSNDREPKPPTVQPSKGPL
jgi:general secretion pathway protein D